jgi:hypothetical protein
MLHRYMRDGEECMSEKLDAELLFEMRAKLLAPIDTGDGPVGRRLVFITPGGRFEGPRLRGEVVAHSGGDWFLMRSDGIGALDVRVNLRTDDGADIYMTYFGRLVCDPTLMPGPPRRGGQFQSQGFRCGRGHGQLS